MPLPPEAGRQSNPTGLCPLPGTCLGLARNVSSQRPNILIQADPRSGFVLNALLGVGRCQGQLIRREIAKPNCLTRPTDALNNVSVGQTESTEQIDDSTSVPNLGRHLIDLEWIVERRWMPNLRNDHSGVLRDHLTRPNYLVDGPVGPIIRLTHKAPYVGLRPCYSPILGPLGPANKPTFNRSQR